MRKWRIGNSAPADLLTLVPCCIVIPAFNHSHVLPPFEGERLTSAHSSPYVVTAGEFVQRFAINTVRYTIINGFMRYRAELRSLGFV